MSKKLEIIVPQYEQPQWFPHPYIPYPTASTSAHFYATSSSLSTNQTQAISTEQQQQQQQTNINDNNNIIDANNNIPPIEEHGHPIDWYSQQSPIIEELIDIKDNIFKKTIPNEDIEYINNYTQLSIESQINLLIDDLTEEIHDQIYYNELWFQVHPYHTTQIDITHPIEQSTQSLYGITLPPDHTTPQQPLRQVQPIIRTIPPSLIPYKPYQPPSPAIAASNYYYHGIQPHQHILGGTIPSVHTMSFHDDYWTDDYERAMSPDKTIIIQQEKKQLVALEYLGLQHIRSLFESFQYYLAFARIEMIRKYDVICKKIKNIQLLQKIRNDLWKRYQHFAQQYKQGSIPNQLNQQQQQLQQLQQQQQNINTNSTINQSRIGGDPQSIITTTTMGDDDTTQQSTSNQNNNINNFTTVLNEQIISSQNTPLLQGISEEGIQYDSNMISDMITNNTNMNQIEIEKITNKKLITSLTKSIENDQSYMIARTFSKIPQFTSISSALLPTSLTLPIQDDLGRNWVLLGESEEFDFLEFYTNEDNNNNGTSTKNNKNQLVFDDSSDDGIQMISIQSLPTHQYYHLTPKQQSKLLWRPYNVLTDDVERYGTGKYLYQAQQRRSQLAQPQLQLLRRQQLLQQQLLLQQQQQQQQLDPNNINNANIPRPLINPLMNPTLSQSLNTTTTTTTTTSTIPTNNTISQQPNSTLSTVPRPTPTTPTTRRRSTRGQMNDDDQQEIIAPQQNQQQTQLQQLPPQQPTTDMNDIDSSTPPPTTTTTVTTPTQPVDTTTTQPPQQEQQPPQQNNTMNDL